MSTMTEAYLAAMARSYANQEGGVTIPADRLKEVVEIQLGFQPLGISSETAESGDDILVAAYFEPAICHAKVTRDDAGLHFKVDWIRGCNHGIHSVRIFPDLFQPGGANRSQCVFYGPDGKNVWVSRNGDREFYVLKPPDAQGGRWTLVGKVVLPAGKTVHSANLIDGKLLTIEADDDVKEWFFSAYSSDADAITWKENARQILVPWSYGIAVKDGELWTVTDYRADQASHGIYRDNKLVVSGVCGNGIAFLSDGSALVSRYGQAYPGCFNGIPGALIYVPAALLNQ